MRANFIPNRMGKSANAMITRPLVEALIAMRLGKGTSEHYHALASAMMIASHICEIVHRHKHLQPEISKALESLSIIYERRMQRTVDDAPWSGTPEEVDDIEDGVEMLKALLKTTPGPTLAKAVRRATKEVEDQTA